MGWQTVGQQTHHAGDGIVAYCDADYAGSGDEGKMKSTTGFVITCANGPVVWCSRKQSIVATSTTEAEYVSAAECLFQNTQQQKLRLNHSSIPLD